MTGIVRPAKCAHPLPGWRATCTSVAVIYVLLAASILVRGARASMAGFGVPEATLASPHYQDAIFWVYAHMLVLGLVVGFVGRSAEDGRFQQGFARLMVVISAGFTFLDVRASDSPLGHGLYRGTVSLAPALVGAVVTLLFAHLALCRRACGLDRRRG